MRQPASGGWSADAGRLSAASRLLPSAAGNPGLSRIAELARRLLRTQAAQVSLLTDVQTVAAGAGSTVDDVGARGPLEDSLCTVTADGGRPLLVTEAPLDHRVAHLPPVTSGAVGSYLGVPLVSGAGHVVGALCVFDPAPRRWSQADRNLLHELAGSVVAELELSALAAEYDWSRLRWDLAIDAAGIGSFDWDLDTDRVDWNEQLQTIFGYRPGEFLPHIEEAFRRILPEDRATLDQSIAEALRSGGEYRAEFRVGLPGGLTRWVAARGRAVRDDEGRAKRLLGAAYDVTEARTARDQAAQVLASMATGFFSVDHDWNFTYLNGLGERILGRSLEDLAGKNLWQEFPGAEDLEFGRYYHRAMQSGEQLSFEAQYPNLRSWFEVRAVPSPEGLGVYFLDVTQRRRAQEEAERAAERLQLLGRVSGELAATLDAEEAVTRLAKLVVPALGDWCLVTVVDEHQQLRDLACWHRDPQQRTTVSRYAQTRVDALTDDSFVRRAMDSGEPQVVSQAATEQVAAVLRPGPARELLVQLAPEAGGVFPLRARGRIVGLLSLFVGPDRAPLATTDLLTAQEVASRAAFALDNTRLYREQQELAEGLQRSLLTEPPEPDHVQVVVRYQPAAEAAAVGGDWYDAFLQRNGATMLVIGDVVGHDVEAAAAMGQLRGMLRGIAFHSGAGPADVLTGLDAAMQGLMMHTTATGIVVRLEQNDDERARGVTRVRWSNAGHPPAMLINPDGSVTPLAGLEADLLLGLDPTAARVETEMVADRGATILLYTDGLVERRGQSLDEGLALLRESLGELAGRELDELCDHLLQRLLPERPEDDVALVAVRLHRQDRPRPQVAGPNVVPETVPPPT